MLPAEQVKTLQELYANRTQSADQFYNYVYALHTRGWSFEDISVPLGVSRSIVGQWKKNADPDHTSDQPAPPHKPRKIRGTLKRVKPDILPEEQEHIKKLAELARQKTRWSNKNSKEFQAAEELTQLINKHVIQRGVSVSRFAQIAGVNRKAIVQRMEK